MKRDEAPAERSPAGGNGWPQRRPRLADIADVVGVHISTVSRVINEDPDFSIRPEVRNSILAAARRQGYRPNAMARALKRSRTGSLAMVVPLLRNPVWSSIQRGALQQARAHGYVVMILEEPLESIQPPDHYQYLVEESRADGLLLATALRSASSRTKVPSEPHVFMNRRGPRPGHDVVMDEESAMALFLGHVAQLGHRRVAIVDGPKDMDTVHRRVQAARGLCATAGLTLTVLRAAVTERGGYDATRRLLQRASLPTALGIGSLNQLFGASRALREAGASVPADVSLVSFDEDECLGYLEVPVTSVSMPLEQLGAASVLALIDRIEGRPGTDVSVGSPMELVHRESTAPPRRRVRTA